MRYWLMKSEPEEFSIDDLKKRRVAPWDGVRNYQARNFLREMKKGDLAFFYHSSTTPAAIVGVMTVEREAYADPSQFDRKSEYFDPGAKPKEPRWFQIDVRFERRFHKPLSLEEIKREPLLEEMVLVKRGRLSVQPVSAAEWDLITKRCE